MLEDKDRENKEHKQYTTPEVIVSLMAAQLNVKKGIVLDPNCGSGSILLYLSNYFKNAENYDIKIVGYERDQKHYSNVCSMAENRELDVEIHNKDFLESNECSKFDAILTNPPYGYQKDIGRLESKFLDKIMQELPDNGSTSIIMPQSFLHRQLDAKNRECLYKNFDIKSIVLLPLGIFEARVHTCMITLVKTVPKSDVIKIIDLRGDKGLHKYRDRIFTLMQKPDNITMNLPRTLITEPQYILSTDKHGIFLKSSDSNSYEQLNLFFMQKEEDKLKALYEKKFLNNGFTYVKGSELFKLCGGKKVLSTPVDKNYPIYPIIDANKISRFTNSFNASFLPTIVINRVGDHCGRAFVIKEKSFVTENSMYISEFLKEFDVYYLCYVFRYLNFNKYKSGAGNKFINQRDIYEREYLLPPFEQQKEFAEEACKMISFDIGGSK